MVVTLQPFLIQFSRFLSEYHKKHIKTTFYLNVTKTKTLLEDTKIELPSKKERNRKLGLIGHGLLTFHLLMKSDGVMLKNQPLPSAI